VELRISVALTAAPNACIQFIVILHRGMIVTKTFMDDSRYDALVDAILDLEPDPVIGQVDRCAIKIVLAEYADLFPFRMAATIIEDEANDRSAATRAQAA